jgi:hypothetical protein
MAPGWSAEWRKYGEDMSWMDGDVKEEAAWDVVFDIAAEKKRWRNMLIEICREPALIPCKKKRIVLLCTFHSPFTVVYITWGRKTRSYISANNCWISANDSKDQVEIYMLITVQ